MNNQFVKKIFIVASIFACLGVAFGAFAAHSLNHILIKNSSLNTFKTAVSYQFYHTFALFALAWASSYWQKINFKLPAYLFVIGIILFSGSLYIYSVTKNSAFAFFTPVGGIILISAWLLTIYKLIGKSDEQQQEERK